VFNISQRHQILRAYRFAKKIVLLDLVEGVHASMHVGGFFTAFAAMKVFLVNLAEMNLLLIELAEVKPGSDARRAGKLYDDVLSREFGSDMDWLRVPKSDLRQTEDPRILRASPESKRNYELVVQKGIVALGKRAKGIPSAYDILSEFERPRVGTLWLVYEESKSMPDGHKTIWNRNKLGPGFPSVMIEQMKPTIVQLFGVLSDALGLLQQIEKELAEALANLKRAWEWKQSAAAQIIPPAQVELQWQQRLSAFQEKVISLNQRIRDYNLEAPADRFHLLILNADKEIAALVSEIK